MGGLGLGWCTWRFMGALKKKAGSSTHATMGLARTLGDCEHRVYVARVALQGLYHLIVRLLRGGVGRVGRCGWFGVIWGSLGWLGVVESMSGVGSATGDLRRVSAFREEAETQEPVSARKRKAPP